MTPHPFQHTILSVIHSTIVFPNETPKFLPKKPNKPKTTIAKTSLLTNNPSLQCSWDLPTPPGAAHKSAYLTAAQHPCELSRSVVSNSLQPRGLQPARFLALWGFSRREYWSGLPFPPPGDLPDPGIEPRPPVSPARAGGFFTHRATGQALEKVSFRVLISNRPSVTCWRPEAAPSPLQALPRL